MFVFLHIPKTAGTSFRFILENTFGWSHCHSGHSRSPVFTRDDYARARRIFPGLKSIAGHNLADPRPVFGPEAFYIVLLREPIMRVFSHYQDEVVKAGSRLTFEETMGQRGILENLQVKLMAGSRDLEKAKQFLDACDFVGLTERFDLSLHVLKQRTTRPLNLNYWRRRVAGDNTIKRSLQNDPRMVALARENNALDLALYDYAMKELFPKRCAAAGLRPDQEVESWEKSAVGFRPRYFLGRMYNRCVYRQLCKFRRTG